MRQTILLAVCHLFSREADAQIYGAIEQDDPAAASAMMTEGYRLQDEADRVYADAHGTDEAWRAAIAWMEGRIG